MTVQVTSTALMDALRQFWWENQLNITIVKPWPQTLSPQTQKPSTKGPWADTKILWATTAAPHRNFFVIVKYKDPIVKN